MTSTEMTIRGRFIAACKQMKNPTKDTNAYKYKYATLDQVVGIVKPALFAQDLALMQRVEHIEGDFYLLRTGICDEHEILDLDERPIVFCGDAQKDGSLETYYRRYSLMTVFGLAGEDDDGAATKPDKNTDKKSDEKKHDSQQLKEAKLYFCRVCEKRGGWEKHLEKLKQDDGFEILKDVPDFWRKQADKIAEEVAQE